MYKNIVITFLFLIVLILGGICLSSNVGNNQLRSEISDRDRTLDELRNKLINLQDADRTARASIVNLREENNSLREENRKAIESVRNQREAITSGFKYVYSIRKESEDGRRILQEYIEKK